MEVKFEFLLDQETNVPKNVEDFAATTAHMVELYEKKNHDYGNSFEKGMDAIGIKYGIGRLYDKMNRIMTISDNEIKVESESIEDSLIDLACYSVMMINYFKNKRSESVENVKFE